MEYVTLNNGVRMPKLGYGVYKITNDECKRCVLEALKAGYRSIDTAQAYYNEAAVGDALKESGIPRDEIFLTTKIWIDNYGYEECRASVLRSMKRLKVDYLDLVLLHQTYGDIYGAWRALEEFYEAGKIRAIGVSNFYADRIVEFANMTRIKPMVDQVEMHVFYQREDILRWCAKYHVQVEAWAPLGQAKAHIFENPVLKEIAAKYGKTTAQVMLRWGMQRNVVVIPKTTHADRMKENFDVFDFVLTDEDMKKIAALDTDETCNRSHRDPVAVEFYMDLIQKRRAIGKP
jgi:2,5-diketo-D-gluconate reductase A